MLLCFDLVKFLKIKLETHPPFNSPGGGGVRGNCFTALWVRKSKILKKELNIDFKTQCVAEKKIKGRAGIKSPPDLTEGFVCEALCGNKELTLVKFLKIKLETHPPFNSPGFMYASLFSSFL